MKHALSIRAATCAALATLNSATFAAGYAVVEVSVKPVVSQGDYTFSQPVAIARDGRTLMLVGTIKDGAAYIAGETCNLAGDSCRRLPPKDRNTRYTAASSDFKRIAGLVEDEQGNDWVVRLNDGVPEYLLAQARANSVNKANVVVGEDAQGHAYRYGSEKETLPSLAGSFAYANSINDSGVVVGQSSTADGEERAIIWNKLGEVRPLQPKTPNGKGHYSIASFITAGGVVYGASTFHDRGFVKHAVRFTNTGKAAVSLGALGSPDSGNTSFAQSANSHGSAVGYSTNSPVDETEQAVLFVNGTVIELATQVPDLVRAKYRLAYATDINEAGQILVMAHRRDSGDPIALRLDPQP